MTDFGQESVFGGDTKDAEQPSVAQFTPGPWHVTTCADYWVEPVGAPDDDGEHVYGIAHCGDISWPGYAKKQREWEANARLVAAAPDMYAALSWFAKLEDEGFDEEGRRALKQARAALDKANGLATDRREAAQVQVSNTDEPNK